MIDAKISDILNGKVEDDVQLKGWVWNIRFGGGIVFIVLRDGTGTIQCIAKKEELGDKFKELENLTRESSIIIRGSVKKDERAPNGYEVHCKDFDIVHVSEEFPIGKKEHGPAFLLDNRHLVLRSPRYAAIMRIKDSILHGAREWFRENGFTEVTPPIISGNSCEGGSTLFELNYFGKKAYLSQSAQLYLEALIFSLGKVYSITPSFRAEKSRTRRHLAEYWHIEAEEPWTTEEENEKIEENLVFHIIRKVLDERKRELSMFRDPSTLERIQKPFPRIKYSEVIDTLQKNGYDIEWGDDLGADEEYFISKKFDSPFFIQNFPKEAKAFYMKRLDEKLVKCADMIAPEGYGEMIGGSERETDVDVLIKRLEEQGENVENYKWYLDLRRYGSVPHSGFGLGSERMVWWICKLDHIRDTIPFPRVINRYYP